MLLLVLKMQSQLRGCVVLVVLLEQAMVVTKRARRVLLKAGGSP